MKIERFKSILLIMLVISSIVLTANKWLSEELWPEGYSFFSDVKNKFSSSKATDSADFNPIDEVLRPAKVIINNSNNHALYTKSQEKYSAISKEIIAIMKNAMQKGIILPSDIDEWNSQLQTKSCYFMYPVNYDASYFASQLSAQYEGSLECFKEFVIAKDARLSSVMYMYIKDALSKRVEKIKINHDSTALGDFIEMAAAESDDINYYSFELNFDADSAKGSSVDDHVVIDDNVLINISEKMAMGINAQNLFSGIEENEALYTEILSKFKFNTSSIRKYIESDNSMVFVENYGTLKLHSGGVLEYKALDASKGISLGTSTNACINSCISFVNHMTEMVSGAGTMYYEISSDIYDINSKTFSLTFDYYIDDNKIIIPRDKYTAENAVNVQVENGKIVSYTQLFVSYSDSGEIINCGSAIDAIDILEDNISGKSSEISDIFIAYSYNNDSKIWYPKWYIKDSEGNVSTISSKTEVGV